MSFSVGLRIASLYVALFASALCSPFATAVTAEQAPDILDTLHQARVSSYLAINGYYNYSVSTGDKSLAAEVNDAIKKVDTNVKRLSTLPGYADVQDSMKSLNEAWAKYHNLLNTNMKDLATQGYPDLRLAGDMAQANVDFAQSILNASDAVKKSANYHPSPQLELARECTIKVEQMMTKYAARTASTVSQVFQGAETEETVDVMAASFSDYLKQMQSSNLNTPETRKILDDVSTKWNFIKNSYINYNENNVSYVVNLYSKKIIEGLENLENLYASIQ